MRRIKLAHTLCLVLAAVSFGTAQINFYEQPAFAARPAAEEIPAGESEGPEQHAKIVVGPFDLHRKYRSMEGPYVTQTFKLGDLINSGQVSCPESSVVFVEGNPSASPSMGAPSMNGASASTGSVDGLKTCTKGKELYWFKGIKLQVLDENDKPLPTAEFICHLNVDIDQNVRKKNFPESEQPSTGRIVTLTQGQTDFNFPQGFAVPVSSDEVWAFTFQAANRTTDEHRRVKQLCTLTFVKDSDLVHPIKALSWFAPYVKVVVDRDTEEAADKEAKHSPSCLGTMAGVTAPNSVPGAVFSDDYGRRLSGHWVVPPGKHTYTSPIIDSEEPNFASKKRVYHAVWSHVHPLCTDVELTTCQKSGQKEAFKVKVETKTEGGLELKNIETISSKEGITIKPGRYQVEAHYDNTTGQPQDSMVVMGMFYEDNTFARPSWYLTSKNEAFCGITDNKSAAKPDQAQSTSDASDTDHQKAEAGGAPSYSDRFPLFNEKSDGPLLTEVKKVELDTSEGKIHIELDPKLAPQHATQLYHLLTNGSFDGTPITRYEPNFVLQVALAETKATNGGKDETVDINVIPNLRRLPLEVSAQNDGSTSHTKWMLSMARYDEDANSAVSSFSIILNDSHHLDKKYTIFGRVIPDAVSIKTIDKIQERWRNQHPVIITAKSM